MVNSFQIFQYHGKSFKLNLNNPLYSYLMDVEMSRISHKQYKLMLLSLTYNATSSFIDILKPSSLFKSATAKSLQALLTLSGSEI